MSALRSSEHLNATIQSPQFRYATNWTIGSAKRVFIKQLQKQLVLLSVGFVTEIELILARHNGNKRIYTSNFL
jgi:hypothetical protein